MISSALPAYAATRTVTSLTCETRSIGFFCEAYVSGGTGGNTYTWSKPTQWRGDGANTSKVTVYCPAGTAASITFTVKDSSNATASKTAFVGCGGNP